MALQRTQSGVTAVRGEEWAIIKDIFNRAVEVEPAARARFLDAACGGDGELRRAVEQLLASHEAAGSFIERPPADLQSTLDQDFSPAASDEGPSLAGRLVGPYRLLRRIGEGGMGAVYLAARDDDQYRKEVAVKLVRGGMDLSERLRRFRHERQILAALDHPNIARLIDGGATEDGLPYLVMEYVAGVPITEYCDAARLPVAARLRLFERVCAAVYYAHQRFVVHRDLKPSNILVTADGEVKLLDFGIAKLLEDTDGLLSDLTTPGERLMTPAYASPEQVRGQPVTTASDVYSLGVILYELLTGRRPYRFRRRTMDEWARVICEQEPERPSTAVGHVEVAEEADTLRAAVTPEQVSRTREGRPDALRRRLKGDLDNIVLKALSKEPERRYGDAEQLAADLRRHLAGHPVTAQRATPLYRSAKFVRRHRVGVGAAAMIALTLVGGSAATLRQADIARSAQRRAEAQRELAVTEQARAEHEAAKAEAERRRAEAKQAEAESQRLLALHSQTVAETERARAEGRFEDVRRLANSFVFEFHDRIAQLDGATPVRALLVQRAIEYLDRLAREARGNLALQEDLAAAYQKIGDAQGRPLYSNLGDTPGALESYRKALDIRREIAAAKPRDRQAGLGLALSYDRYGDALGVTGDAARSFDSYRSELRTLEPLARQSPQDVQVRRDLGRALMKVGDALGTFGLAGVGDSVAALEHYRRSLAEREAVAAANPGDVDDTMDLGISHNRLSQVLFMLGDAPGALQAARRCLTLARENAAAHPNHAQAKREVALSQNAYGVFLAANGKTREALANEREALVLIESLAASDPRNANFRLDLTLTLQNIGSSLFMLGDSAGALKALRRAAAEGERLSDTDAQNDLFRRSLVATELQLAQSLLFLGENGPARELGAKALARAEPAAARHPENVCATYTLATARQFLTQILNASGDAAGAAAQLDRLLPLSERLARTDPRNAVFQQLRADVLNLQGALLEARGEAEGAEARYREVVALSRRLAARDPQNANTAVSLAWAQIGLGRLLAGARKAGAEEPLNAALEAAARLSQNEPGHLFHQYLRASALVNLGMLESLRERPAAAADRFTAGLRLLEGLEAADPAVIVFRVPPDLLWTLAVTLDRAGRPEEARRYGARFLALLKGKADGAAATPVDLAAYADQLLDIVPADLRRPAEAVEYARRAVERGGGKEYQILRVLIKAYHRSGDRSRAVEAARAALALAAKGSAERQELEVFMAEAFVQEKAQVR